MPDRITLPLAAHAHGLIMDSIVATESRGS